MNGGSYSRVPPAAKIAATLQIELATARRIRKILKGQEDPRTVEQTDAWVRSCYHEPAWREQAEHAVDVLLETSGVEAAFATGGRKSQRIGWPEFTYCNAGDTYATTIVFDRRADAVLLTCWGDTLERFERTGVTFD